MRFNTAGLPNLGSDILRAYDAAYESTDDKHKMSNWDENMTMSQFEIAAYNRMAMAFRPMYDEPEQEEEQPKTKWFPSPAGYALFLDESGEVSIPQGIANFISDNRETLIAGVIFLVMMLAVAASIAGGAS